MPEANPTVPTPRSTSTVAIVAGILISAVLLAATAHLAHRKIIWTDEIFTVLIARQPTITDLLTALRDGPDALPPLNHLLTRASIAIVGDSHLAYRLPSIVFFWLASVVTFFLFRRVSRTAACVAALFPVGTGAFAYAFEARPYAALMFFMALALLAWSRAIESARNAGWLALLAIAIAGAIWSHWYGVLVLVPLAFGELARAADTRRLDWRVALTLVAGALPTVLLAPIAAHAAIYRGMMLPPNPVPFLQEGYELVLGRPPLVILVLLAAGAVWRRRTLTPTAEFSRPFVTAVIATALLPMAGYAISVLTGGQLAARYVIHASIGVSIVIAYGVHAASEMRRWIGTVALGAVIAAALMNVYQAKLGLRERSWIAEGKAEFLLLREPRQDPLPSDPIVLRDLHVYLPLWFYAPSPLRGQLVFVRRYDRMASESMVNGERYFGLRTVDFDTFIGTTRDFLFYEAGRQTPLLAAFLVRGGIVCDSGALDDREIYPRPGYLLRVSLPGGAGCREPKVTSE